MPPVTLHCLVHLSTAEYQKESFPAIHAIKYSLPDSKEHYSLWAMMIWATVPYALWQLAYHFLITVKRREKIAAGRPTSFTWLRKSYAKAWIGRLILSLPDNLQEPAFMLVQYSYALGTMIPCPIWFWYRWASSAFLMSVFVWSIYNGATFYIDVYSKKFQIELEQLKKDVSKWQTSPDTSTSPRLTPKAEDDAVTSHPQSIGDALDLGVYGRSKSIDHIPMLDSKHALSTGSDKADEDAVCERG